MNYEDASYFAQTWGLVFLVVLFAGALFYALRPRNRDLFRRAAQSPLKETERPFAPEEKSDSNGSDSHR